MSRESPTSLMGPPSGEKIRQSSLDLSCPAVLMLLNHGEIVITSAGYISSRSVVVALASVRAKDPFESEGRLSGADKVQNLSRGIQCLPRFG